MGERGIDRDKGRKEGLLVAIQGEYKGKGTETKYLGEKLGSMQREREREKINLMMKGERGGEYCHDVRSVD